MAVVFKKKQKESISCTPMTSYFMKKMFLLTDKKMFQGQKTQKAIY